MSKLLVKSKQPDIIVKHNGKPSFEYNFETEPLEVDEEHIDFLCKNKNFEVINVNKKKRSGKK